MPPSLPSGYKPSQDCVPVFAALTIERPHGAEPLPRLRVRPAARRLAAYEGRGALPRASITATSAPASPPPARYAHPLPAPVCHVFEYELPAGTQLQIGTVLPCTSARWAAGSRCACWRPRRSRPAGRSVLPEL
ncbi:MAG: hypothetical protein MZW92_08085 [Comamonadaceae bacterium]|nr:hypothetical protein [Comamonadaceae bacterium]